MSAPTHTLRNDKSFATASLAGNGGTASDPDAANRKNLLLLIQLRWLAVAGQVLTILVTQYWFDIPLPLGEMAGVVVFLVGLNIFSLLALRGQRPISNAQLFVALIFDMAIWRTGASSGSVCAMIMTAAKWWRRRRSPTSCCPCARRSRPLRAGLSRPSRRC